MDGFSTRAIRAVSRPPRVDQRPTSVPIYQAVTFSSDSTDELADVTNRRIAGYSYGRIASPTADALGSAIAELEGAEAGYAVASGMAAIHLALLALVRAGDRIVCTRAVYGTTRALLVGTFERLGVTTEFVDPTNRPAVEAVLAAAPTRVLYLETISNPTMVVSDIAALAEIGRRHGAAVVVDNTFASPYLCRPLELGADLVVESATKYLSGHSDVLAGVVAGSQALIDAVRDAQVQTGATIAPFAAFLVLRGIATLAVRMDRHAASASTLAAWLATEQGVSRVLYPGLPSHPDRAVAGRQLANGGGMLAVELAGGAAAGRAFIDALRIPERTASLGSIHTIVVHPPSTTHRQLDPTQLREAGISPGLLRISVGLEDVDDLRDDLARGLAAAREVTGEVGEPAGGW
jgi:cystathionine beta-lyase/cystathionine gamma-synthase